MTNWKALTPPVFVFTVVAAISVGFYFFAERVERSFLLNHADFAALEFSVRTKRYINDRLLSAASLQDTWSQRTGDVEQAFRDRATSLVHTFGGLLAVNWVDPSGHIRWVAPLEPNIEAVDQNLFENPAASATIRLADSTGSVRITPPLELYQGGRGLAAYLPMEANGERLGFINVVFRLEPLFAGVVGDDVFLHGFDLWMTVDGDPLLPMAVDSVAGRTARATTRLAGVTFEAFAQPKAATVAQAESQIGELILGLGLLLAGLSAVAAFGLVRSRERLAETTEHLQATLDAVPDIHVVIGPDGRIVDVQAPDDALHLIGPEATGKRLGDVFPSDLANRVEAAMSEVTGSGIALPFEYSTRAASVPQWFEASVLPMGGRQYLLIARDVTERKRAESEQKRLEEQLLRTQKLESLGVMAGGIAHDFNNILTSILGNADLARGGVGCDTDTRELLDQIVRSSERAADLCNQMLAYAGRGRFSTAPVDLSEIVGEVREMLDASLSKKVNIEYDLDPEIPAVEADATQMRQVAMNLVVNASEALGEQRGSVVVSTGSLYCGLDSIQGVFQHGSIEPGEYVCLEVADNGPGMDEAAVARAFEPFHTTKETGRGLGLAAVLGIVRGHRGALTVQSKPGKGTTFIVWLPVTALPKPVRSRASEESPLAWRGQGRVLVVDDEKEVLDSVAAMVERLGFEVLRASNGSEALDAVRQNSRLIDVVILDVTMPDLSGIEVLREIRVLEPEIPVVLSSGFSEFDPTANPATLRHEAFLHKPYRMGSLAEVLRDLTSAATEG